MSTSLLEPLKGESSLPSDKTLGEVLDYLCGVKPQSVDCPADITALKTCGNEAVVGLADGRVMLVTASSPAVSYVFDSPEPHTGKIYSLAVSPDLSKVLSAAYDGVVKLWDVQEKREIASLKGHTARVFAVAFSSDGKVGYSASHDDSVKVWDLENMCELSTLVGAEGGIWCLAVTKDGKLCYTGNSRAAVRVWNTETQAEIATLLGHSDGILSMALSAKEDVLWTLSEDRTIRAWNTTDLTLITVFSGHKGKIYDMFLLKAGRECISVSYDRQIKVWSLETQGEIATLSGHTMPIYCFTVAKNEKWCVSCDSGMSVFIWDLETYSVMLTFPMAHTDYINMVVLSQDNRHFFTGSSDKTCKVWSVESKDQEWTLATSSTVQYMDVADEFIAFVEGSNAKLWNIRENKLLGVLACTSQIYNVKVTPDQKCVMTVNGNDIKLWDVASCTELHCFTGQTDPYRLAIFANGKFFVSSGWDYTVMLWSIEEKRMLKSVDYTRAHVRGFILTPDNKHVLGGDGDGRVLVWSLPSLELVATLHDHFDACSALAITPDGKMIFSGGRDKVIRMWSFEERRVVSRLYGHAEYVEALNVSKDGKYLVSASDDTTVRVWSLQELREVACLPIHSSDVWQVALTANNEYLITSSTDSTVRKTAFAVPYETINKQPLQVSSELAMKVSYMKNGTLLKHPRLAKTLLSPYNVNSLHISAYYNYSERCKEYLDMGVLFLKGVFGSPLTVSLARRTVNCTDVFLKYLIERADALKGDSEWPLFVCVTDDIVNLLGSGSALIPAFFSILMQSPSSPPLPHFITPTSPLPMVKFQDNRYIHIQDFDMSQKGELGTDLVKFNLSIVKKNLTAGSTESVEFMEALLDCEDKTVLRTDYVSSIIEHKWEYFYPITLGLTIIYAVMLVSLTLLLFDIGDKVPMSSVFLAINVFLMLYEVAQMLASSCSYWFDLWNYVDMFRGLLCLFWGVLVLTGGEDTMFGEEYKRMVRMILALLCFLRGFTYFRGFKMTRVFVYMTMAVVQEMYSFLIIIAYSVFTFGVCLSILLRDHSLSSSVTQGFLLVLGDFDASPFGLVEWIIFAGAVLVNIIIMMNLLISILGDAYEMTQMSVRENDCYMMLDLVAEYESLMVWCRNAGSPTVMVYCQNSVEAGASDDWAGKIVELKESITSEISTAQTVIKEQITALKSDLEKKIEIQAAEMKKIGEKLETLIALQSSGSK